MTKSNARASAGLALKPEHFVQACADLADGLWFEVHPENYMVAGGPRLTMLEAVREDHPVSLHGVSMSLAADSPPDDRHLKRFAELVNRIDPILVSEHLAWSTWQGRYHPDLLPFPRHQASLNRIVDNVSRMQDVLKRSILIENPSHYLRIDGHEFDEIEFLTQIAKRSGCALLMDVNNVFVSARNLGFDARDYLDQLPAELIAEVHMAGHSEDPEHGNRLLIDSHDAPIDTEVWSLYRHLLARIGARMTLIERDANLPAYKQLMTERNIAQDILQTCRHEPVRALA